MTHHAPFFFAGSRFSSPDVFKIITPSFLGAFLFIFSVFQIFLPASRNALLEQKKEMIGDLTRSTWSILQHFDRQIQTGKIDKHEAQRMAAELVRQIRYGEKEKNYFWINDLEPRMVMHPYRSELEGEKLAEFSDPRGTQLFAEMVTTVQKNKAGFVPYLWQWQDDPSRIEEKISYVKLFEPWGWIIGTGIYLDDVEREIDALHQRLLLTSVAIIALIAILSLYIIRQGITENKKRRMAEEEVRHYQNELEELVTERTAKLQKALSEVKTLSGFLPICASCKNIRDDKGYWNRVETYIKNHSEAEFTHSICPDCARKLYPDIALPKKKSKN